MVRSMSVRLSVLALFSTLLVTGCSLGSRAAEMTSTVIVGGSKIDITIQEESGPVAQADVLAWVQAAAESVAGYYGRFPVPHLDLRVATFSGHGVRHGMTFGMHGGMIKIGVGAETTRAELMNDWMMTHEMIHLAFPSVAEEHHWIEEGISTYVEPIARIRAKHMNETQMWSDLVRDMPKGQPQDGDEGLDHTHTWGRTYWGGALFCFDADVEIRRQTQNKKGLQDALRGILDAGGNITEDWELSKALKIGDQATGVHVLTDLYQQMKDKPVKVDLAQKWKELGVEGDGNNIHLNDQASEASIRRAIMGSDAGGVAARTSGVSAQQPKAVFAGRKIST
jgi:hypothetical protein